MVETKQLVLVVESTSALGPYWSIFLSNYLEKIIRSFSGYDDPRPDSPSVELGLVNYNLRESAYNLRLVEKRGWTNNVDVFMGWLCSLNFNGYLFPDAPIEQGLTEALKMFPCVNIGIQNPQRHCILIAATNPYPLPKPIYTYNNSGMQPGSHMPDAETVAKSFPRFLVSLSVISPRQLPKLEAIYNAAKWNPSAINPSTVFNVKNPDYIVLISENFMEARAALSQPQITNLPSSQRPVRMDFARGPLFR